MRLAAAEMVQDAHALNSFSSPIDAVFATSLMSAADLRALLLEHCARLPLVLYMHENQATYPHGQVRWSDYSIQPVSDEAPQTIRASSRPPQHDVQFALTNFLSMLAADLVIWNSQWNQRSFLEGLEHILKHAPDLTLQNAAQRIVSRSVIIWPPVELPPKGMRSVFAEHATAAIHGERSHERNQQHDTSEVSRVLHNSEQASDRAAIKCSDGCHNAGSAAVDAQYNSHERQQQHAHGTPQQPIRVVWPHRWEHDKGPDELLCLVERFTRPLNIRWTILGEQFRQMPPAMSAILERFSDCIDHAGYVNDRDEYWRHLSRCDWVLSTARHEFFGIAVVEAMFAGCLPWLPASLSYPELLPPNWRAISPLNPPGDRNTVRLLQTQLAAHLKPAIADNAVARLDDALEELIQASRRRRRATDSARSSDARPPGTSPAPPFHNVL